MSSIVAIRAVVVLIGLTIVGIVVLTLFHDGDSSGAVLQLLAVVVPTSAAMMTLAQSTKNNEVIAKVDTKVDQNTAITDAANKQIRELKITVDGRLQQLLEKTEQAARLTGAQEERDRVADVPPPAGSTPPRGTARS